jgi:hypothetical protein
MNYTQEGLKLILDGVRNHLRCEQQVSYQEIKRQLDRKRAGIAKLEISDSVDAFDDPDQRRTLKKALRLSSKIEQLERERNSLEKRLFVLDQRLNDVFQIYVFEGKGDMT